VKWTPCEGEWVDLLSIRNRSGADCFAGGRRRQGATSERAVKSAHHVRRSGPLQNKVLGSGISSWTYRSTPCDTWRGYGRHGARVTQLRSITATGERPALIVSLLCALVLQPALCFGALHTWPEVAVRPLPTLSTRTTLARLGETRKNSRVRGRRWHFWRETVPG
jgi:hypothetical protein